MQYIYMVRGKKGGSKLGNACEHAFQRSENENTERHCTNKSVAYIMNVSFILNFYRNEGWHLKN